jgi:hypothetical protein
MIDAIHACFGVGPDAPPHELIGVAPDASREEILERATQRLRAIHARFPEHDPAFIAARARLRAAARDLVERSTNAADPDGLRALIASSGGWNRKARARALRWAAMHGVDPVALVELLGGPSSDPVAPSSAGGAAAARAARRDRDRSWLPWAIGSMAAILALAATATLTLAVLDRGRAEEPIAKAPKLKDEAPSTTTEQSRDRQPAPAPDAPPSVDPPHAPNAVPSIPEATPATRERAPAPSTDWDQLAARLEGSRLSAGAGVDAELSLLERVQALTEAALLLEAGRVADARLILDGMPEAFRAPEPAVQRRRSVGDGGLAVAIERADGPEARVLALNRWLGAANEIGPSDARTLASLACGPEDGLSRRARAVTQARFASSAEMAMGWLDVLAVADAGTASTAIGAWLGRAGLDATSTDGAIRIRQALVERAIALAQGEADSIRQRVAACQLSWERIAPLLGAVPARGSEGDLGTASIEAIVQGSIGTGPARAAAALRLRAADSEVARFIAWQAALLDALALPAQGALRAERAAAERALDLVADSRAGAMSALEQAIANQRAITRAVGVRAGRWTW